MQRGNLYRETKTFRSAVNAVAKKYHLRRDWMNDVVAGFLPNLGQVTIWRSYQHLVVYVPQPEYILALKLLSGREKDEELVKEPIRGPVEVTPELHRRATFCAAAVEYLCEQYAIPCPEWVNNPAYMLSEPWFKGLGAQKPHVQARLAQETPEPFTRRNIFCGDRMFANKYELAARVRHRQTA